MIRRQLLYIVSAMGMPNKIIWSWSEHGNKEEIEILEVSVFIEKKSINLI